MFGLLPSLRSILFNYYGIRYICLFTSNLFWPMHFLHLSLVLSPHRCLEQKRYTITRSRNVHFTFTRCNHLAFLYNPWHSYRLVQLCRHISVFLIRLAPFSGAIFSPALLYAEPLMMPKVSILCSLIGITLTK